MVAGGVDRTAARACRHAAHGEAACRRRCARADGPQRGGDGLDAIGLLGAQLGCSADAARAARHRRGQREERQLVDHARHLRGNDLRRHELGVRDLEVGHRLDRTLTAG